MNTTLSDPSSMAGIHVQTGIACGVSARQGAPFGYRTRLTLPPMWRGTTGELRPETAGLLVGTGTQQNVIEFVKPVSGRSSWSPPV